MKKSKLSTICGLKVADAVLAEDDAGISFEGGVSLTIYNKYKLIGFELSDAQGLIGNTVTHVEESVEVITIRFDNNWELLIDMRDEAYGGPEAMQLQVPGEQIVIWN